MPTENSDTPTLEQELADIEWPAGDSESTPSEPDVQDSSDENDEVEQPEGDAEEQPSSDEPDTFTVKVNGKQVEVGLDELLKGYQRQADYTRKTQELSQRLKEAEAAQDLVDALRNDPQGTLQLLNEQLGYDTGTDDLEDVDPMNQRLSRLEQMTAQQEEQAFLAKLDSELATLADHYGEDFVPDDVLNWAVENDIPNLRAAYLDLREARQEEEAIASRNREVASRKRNTPPVAGRSRSADSRGKPQRGQAKTIEEAMAFALEDHNVTDLAGVAGWGHPGES